MRRRMLVSVFIMTSVFLSSCASSRTSIIGQPTAVIGKVETIALAPSGGLLADAIGVELFNRGFNVIDTADMSQLAARLNLNELEITRPQNLQTLKGQGIDVYLSIKSAAAYDGLPQSASVRINSTSDGKVVGGCSWQNGWGGVAGSISDRVMRKDITAAAVEITNILVKQLRK